MSFVEIRELPAEIGIISHLARALLNTCQTQPREEAMFIKFTSKLDQAIALSIAAITMLLAMSLITAGLAAFVIYAIWSFITK